MVTSWFGVLLGLLLGLSVPLPLGIPPRPEDPALVLALPRDAVAAVQWFGLASPDARSGNAVERFAAHPEVRHLFAEIDRAAMAWCLAQEAAADAAPLRPMQAAGLLRVALTNPGIAFLEAFDLAAGPASLRAGILLRVGTPGAGPDAARSLFETLKAVQGRVEKAIGAGEGHDLTLGRAAARSVALPPEMPRVVFGQSGEYVFLAAGTGVAEALARGLEQQDGLGAQPAFTAAHARARTERPVLRFFGDVPRVLALAGGELGERERAAFARLGLDGVRHLLLENGLEGDAMRARAFLGVDGAPRGLLHMLAGTALAAPDLACVPADASLACALTLDPAPLVDWLGVLMRRGPVAFLFDDPTADPLPPEEDDLLAAVRADLVACLGPSVTAWNSPGQGGFWFTGATVAVSVRDAARAQRTHQRILERLRTEMPPRSSERDPTLPRKLEKASEQLQLLQGVASAWQDSHDGRLPRFDDLDQGALGQIDPAREAGKPPVDPWSRPYRIVDNQGVVAIASDGPDGKTDTDDDLTAENAWERQWSATMGRTTLEQTTFGSHTLHYLNPGGYEPFAPAWCLTDTHLVVSLNLPVLKAALHHLQSREPSLATVPAVGDALGSTVLFAQSMRAEFPLLYGIGKIAAVYLCRSLQKDGFDITVDALPSAAAFRGVLDHELLSLRPVDGGFLLERRGRLPNLLGLAPILPLPFVFGSF